jgi:hypothetical protein
MYSEKEVRQILHDRKRDIQFHIKQKEIYGEELNKDFIELLNRDIILLQEILEESAWQKLMGQTKKEKVFIRRFNIMCDYLFRSLK